MRSLLSNIPLLIILFVAFQIVRAIKRAQEASKTYKASGAETDEQRRVREIQERIRRIAAERRGEAAAAPRPLGREVEPPRRPLIVLPEPRGALDPFGGPDKRDWREVRPVEPAPKPEATPHFDAAELERQQGIVDQLRLLRESQAAVKRRAAYLDEENATAAQSESGLRTVSRGQLLEDLMN